ncbi:Rne/Rng family ribonuclease [Bacillus sp. T33-2]|uniref:Rne/Rng family ribonuclease n=1 Tax=Bacillus sp. T33-2 TaxID=2054168 RepID=UPI000C75E1AA|nr:Rne/Rng family ribonuclease [Bacillus sp. T33-2]PLR93725.1 ribonuclease E/G [Bacillus sp. T33-2]
MKLVVNSATREKRYALLKNGKIDKLYIEQPGQQSLVGNIYLGTVEKVLPGMNAAFVDIGQGKNAFLHKDKIPSFVLSNDQAKANRSVSSFLHQGEKLLVQVEKDAAGTKGPRVTGIIELQGQHVVYMPNGKYVAVSRKLADEAARDRMRQFGTVMKTEEEGLIFRTSSINASEATLINELEQLRTSYRQLLLQASPKKTGLMHEKDYFFEQLARELERMDAGEIIVDSLEFKKNLEPLLYNKELKVSYYNGKENIFSHYKLEHEVEKALKRIVWLDNGAYLVFDMAEALTIIDVNTGKFSGKHDLKDTVLAANLLAAEEIARQLRLRDIGGMVLIDFIDMQEEDRKKVVTVLARELAKDERRTNLIGFTPLGILQLTRKKTKISISEALQENCGTCNGTGKVLSPETVAFRLERELWENRNSDHEAVLVAATSAVEEVFSGTNKEHKQRIEEATGLKIFFVPLETSRAAYEIRQFGSEVEVVRSYNGK